MSDGGWVPRNTFIQYQKCATPFVNRVVPRHIRTKRIRSNGRSRDSALNKSGIGNPRFLLREPDYWFLWGRVGWINDAQSFRRDRCFAVRNITADFTLRRDGFRVRPPAIFHYRHLLPRFYHLWMYLTMLFFRKCSLICSTREYIQVCCPSVRTNNVGT